MAKAEKVDTKTGLVEDLDEQLNKIIHVHTKRPNGTLRIQTDYKNCPTMTEQHSANETDLNYLIKKFKPDELAAYITARNQHRKEILGHDFSKEPSLTEAKNTIYLLKSAFNALPPEIKNNFKNHVEFLKFIDNPANQEKMIRLGLLDKQQIQNLTDPQLNNDKQNDEKTAEDSKSKSQKNTQA